MATLELSAIKCYEQEDVLFDDDIEIVVYTPSRKVLWRKSMDTGQSRSLSLSADFTGSIKLQLVEKDVDGDDALGTVTITDAPTVDADREARFTGDGANYTVWYSVSNPATDVDDREDEYDECNGDNPLLDWLEDYFGPYLEYFGIEPISKPKKECPLGTLVVKVVSDGKPLAGADVAVREIGLRGKTGPDGTFDAGMVMEGEYTCEASKELYTPNPGMTKGYVNAGQCTVIEVQLGKVEVVEVRPKSGKTIRQYVNLDQDESKNRGRELTIEAEIKPKIEGLRVYFQLRYDSSNRNNPPEPTELTSYSALTDANGVAKTKIKFGRYGGDFFRVGARLNKDEDPKVFSAWFQIWRKMYYDITEMKNPKGGVFPMEPGTIGIVKNSYDKVFIELQYLGKRIGSEYVDNFDSADDAFDWADKYCTSIGTPWKIHYAVVAAADKKKEETKQFPDITVKKGILQIKNSSGTMKDFWFKPWRYHGEDWLVSAEYREKGAFFWSDFPDGSISTVDTTGDKWRRIQFDFAKTDADPTATPHEIKLTYYRISGIFGWGGTSLHLAIARELHDEKHGSNTTNLRKEMADSCIHEPGHSLGLVYSQPWKSTVASEGYHCGISKCTMRSGGNMNYPFFHVPADGDPGCETWLRGKDMSRSEMEDKWSFPR